MILENAQELGLEIEGDLADFVEEDGAFVGEFEAADLFADGAGEGAFFVAEELAFEEAGGDGGAIHFDEGIGGAATEAVNGAGDEFFAGAGFAEEEDGGVAGSDFADALHDGHEGGALSDDFVEAEAGGDFALEIEFFLSQLFFGETEFFLGAFAIGDVVVNANHAEGLAVRIIENAPAAGDPVDGAIGPDDAPFSVGLAGLHGLFQETGNLRAIVGMNQIEEI